MRYNLYNGSKNDNEFVHYCGAITLQDDQLSTAYFRPFNFIQDTFRRWKAFISDKYSFFWKFSNFSKFKNLPIFFAKNLNLGGKKTFLRNKKISFEFYNKFATFTDFEKKSCSFF